MENQIGKVKLNYQFYQGSDQYSDDNENVFDFIKEIKQILNKDA